MDNYVDVLNSLGVAARENGIWASVGHSDLEFGWKLHLSSVQSDAEGLLRSVVSLLLQHNVPFKVARDADILGELNEGTFGYTQVGKFVTIYPPTPEGSLKLAEELVSLTQQFVGPAIVTDLHIGGVVYTRYGSYSPRFRRDKLGNMLVVDDQEGDTGYKVPFTPPRNQSNPFVGYCPKSNLVTTEQTRPIGPGYLLTHRLSSHAKGSVFLGIDVRSQGQVGMVLLKEGRRFCMSDRYGRHIWDRLRHQFDIAQYLDSGDSGVNIARARDLFEHGDSLFLVLNYIDGTDFSARSVVPFGLRPPCEQVSLITEFMELVQTLGTLHEHNVVHRDLSPRNVRVTPEGQIFLLDLEMSYRIGDNHPPFMKGTAGFMSPQQAAGDSPAFADDIYSLGCLLVNALTGFDPRRLSLDLNDSLADRLQSLIGAPHFLIDPVVNTLQIDPNSRPSLREFGESLGDALEKLKRGDSSFHRFGISKANETLQTNLILKQSLDWLVDGGIRYQVNGLPLSPEIQSSHHEASLAMPQAYRLYRSTSRGVAGVVYAVARLSRLGIHTDSARFFVERAVDWLLNHDSTPDDQMPGLHFGEAGVAMAMVEAVRAGFIEPGQWLHPYLKEALSGPVDWPDLTHGAAGQGLAALHCAAVLNIPELAQHANECSTYLVDNQRKDGSWSWPVGVDGMEGTIYSGFAHGVAGIVYFLAGYHRCSGSSLALAAAERGANWLLQQARPAKNRNSVWWPKQVGDEHAWHWWCHGGPGISLALLALYEVGGNEKYADMARTALRWHPVSVRHPNLSQCHGLSGLGEIYLEAYRVLGDEEWRMRAAVLGQTLLAMRFERKNKVNWLVENPYHPTADLMIGCGGIGHFLARLSLTDGKALGMPLSFDPEILAARSPISIDVFQSQQSQAKRLT